MTNDGVPPPRRVISPGPGRQPSGWRPGDDTSPAPREIPTPILYRAERRAALARRVRSGDLERLRRGRYLPTATAAGGVARRREQQVLRMVAAVAGTLSTDYVFSHETAALLHGLSHYRMSTTVHVSQGWKPPRRTPGDQLRRHSIVVPDRDRTVVGGLPVTSLERTLVDCARWLSGPSALVVADSALRAGADQGVVRQVLARAAGRPGIKQARHVVSLADERAESPGESLVRWFVDDAGVEAPDLAVEAMTAAGRYWVDLGWPGLKVAVEFDGTVKYSSGEYGDPRERLLAEKRRHDALTEAGWLVIHVVWADLSNPARLIGRIRAALAAGERRRGVP